MIQGLHPCEIVYQAAGMKNTSGIPGTCRITGKQSTGVLFHKWVKDTFTDHGYLKPGNIISNEALFCFDESSELIQKKTGRDKLQKFRTYSHIVTKSGEWMCCTKANKEEITEFILSDSCEIISLTESGQKHVFFKNRLGFWQLDESFVAADVEKFRLIHGLMMELLTLGFGQEQVKTGKYNQVQIIKVGFPVWQKIESQLSKHRGDPFFDFVGWLMYSQKEE